MIASDRVCPEIREVEKQIDVFYCSNPLLKDTVFRSRLVLPGSLRRSPVQGTYSAFQARPSPSGIVTDEIVNNTKWPFEVADRQ